MTWYAVSELPAAFECKINLLIPHYFTNAGKYIRGTNQGENSICPAV